MDDLIPSVQSLDSQLYFNMGNTHCCEDYKQKDYISQVPEDPIPQHHFKSESSSPFKANNNNPNNQSSSKIKEQGRSSSHRGNENTSQKPIPVQVIESEKITVPELHPFIRQIIKAKNYFQGKEPNKSHLKRYGEDVYQGQLDNDDKYPHGFGKMYKSDGSLYIGHFEKGKAEGQGVFLMPEGVIYQGHFHNNYAQGQGKYEWKDVTYQGNFLKNKFHGFGKESSKDYQFQGEYYEGNKNQGLFKWKDAQGYDYMYKGAFNFKNQFHGEGVLAEPSGTYTGDFVNGIKQGKGIYKYTNGLRYEGDYVKGKKQGTGIIYNYNNSIAYEGEFDNDMPHGKGFIYGKQGEKIASDWVKGIDSTYL